MSFYLHAEDYICSYFDSHSHGCRDSYREAMWFRIRGLLIRPEWGGSCGSMFAQFCHQSAFIGRHCCRQTAITCKRQGDYLRSMLSWNMSISKFLLLNNLPTFKVVSNLFDFKDVLRTFKLTFKEIKLFYCKTFLFKFQKFFIYIVKKHYRNTVTITKRLF